MPDHEPKPLKFVWARWRPDSNADWDKWSAYVFEDNFVLACDPKKSCWMVAPHRQIDGEREFTADTPPPGDCCKRCTERMEQ